LRHHRLPFLGVAVVAVILASVGPALATDTHYDLYDPEPSFAEWWNDDGLMTQYTNVSGMDWDDTYGEECYERWLSFNTQHSHYNNGIWGNGDAFSELEIEFTSGFGSHTFGWYSRTGYDDTTTPSVLHEIFSGSDTPGTTWNSTASGSGWTNPDHWGFYYQAAGHTYYSDWHLNDPSSFANGVRAEVFEDPRYYSGWGWAIGWEDGSIPNTGRTHTFFENPNGDSDNSDMGTLAWAGNSDNEPDYQDLVVTFRRHQYGETRDRNDDSPELGTWVLLLATAAFGGWIKRRRKEG